jgi:hypothetical protein
MDLRGDSNLASFSAAGCQAPGCPGSSRFLLRLRCSLRVSPCAAPSGFTGVRSSRRVEVRILRRCRLTVSGLPRTALLRYRRRPSCELPRSLHLPAPADESHRVPPACSPSGFVRENLRVTPKLLWPLAPSTDLTPDRPGASVLRRCRLTEFRFAPKRCPSAVAVSVSSGLPDSSSTAGSMMNPSCPRTLHPQLAPRMNLRVQSGFAVPV